MLEIPVNRAISYYRSEGLWPFVRASITHTANRMEALRFSMQYRMRYGATAPRANERRHIDPERIDYAMSKRQIPSDAPLFGIIGGSWDLEKVSRRSVITRGLRERFEEGKEWEETEYYQTGVNKIRDGIQLKRLDSEEQTVETLEQYLARLDTIYEDMRSNGFDTAAPVPVNIGRDGEWILHGDGNHRTALATAAGIERMPVIIRYRHERWHAIRQEIAQANHPESVQGDAVRHLDHPDVADLI